MIYDSTISSEISLSRILDAMIITDEKPSVIISFLKLYEDDFNDIILNSSYSSRIFQLDFYLRMSFDEQGWFIEKLANSSQRWLIGRCIWQILRYGILTNTSNTLQHKKELHSIIKNINYQHPYSCGKEKFIVEFDNLCFEFAKNNQISLIPTLIDNEKISRFFKYITNSLFVIRIFQEDFFCNLSVVAKWHFINTALKYTFIDEKVIRDFLAQIIESNENIDVKLAVIKMMRENGDYKYILGYNNSKIRDIIDECVSFSDFILQLSLFNFDQIQTIVLHLILNKPDWIKEWAEFDKEGLNNVLNCSNIAEKIMVNI